jgi:hypothetical protein
MTKAYNHKHATHNNITSFVLNVVDLRFFVKNCFLGNSRWANFVEVIVSGISYVK